MKKIPVIISLGLVVFVLYSCNPKMYTPTASSVTGSVTLENLTEGRNLYVSKCGECHRLHKASQYSSSEWKHNVDKMQKKAHITDSQKELVYQYLIAAPGKKKL